MKSVLVFNFYPAFLPPKNGGEAHLYNFYFELSKVFNVTLLSSGGLGYEPETIWHTNNFVEKRVPKESSLFVEQWQILTPHAGEGDLSGPCVAACGKYLTDLHKAYLEHYPTSDIIIHEFPFTLDYDLFLGLDNKPRIYNSNNCESELYKKLHASASTTTIAELVLALELRLLAAADLVACCGMDDLIVFEKLMQRKLPHGVCISRAMSRAAARVLPTNTQEKHAIFMGSGHPPNIDAAAFIVEVLSAACPEIIFDIIGSCLPDGNYPANIVRHGIVDAEVKARLIGRSDIAINPMFSGSGINLKVLEFVATGVPILSTAFGMRGFDFRDGVDCILAEREQFPELLKRWIYKTDALNLIAQSAREMAMQRYSWPALIDRFQTLLDGTIASKQLTADSKPYVLCLNDYDPFHSLGGGVTRLLGLYSAIAEWSEVIVLCFSKGTSLEVTEITPRIKCIRVPKTIEQIKEEKYFNSRFHISADDILTLKHATANSVLTGIYNVLRRRARIVVCDHPYMVPLPSHFGDRFVYSSQNFEYGLKKAMLEWHPDHQMLLQYVHDAERLCVSSSALVVAVSSEDAASFSRGMAAAAPIIVIPNGAGIPAPPNPDDLSNAERKIGASATVFLGSAHMPNVDAAQFIVQSLALQCPDVEFHIVGGVCQALPDDTPANVIKWGILNDSMKSAVLQRCKLAINPMFSGGGSNIKLADFIANGLHVVSTSFGMRGYPPSIVSHVTVAELALFAETITKMLRDPSISDNERIAERKQFFAEHLSMHSIAKEFVELLRDLEEPKMRMLFVTCRYTAPSLGGAEAMLLKLIAAAGDSGLFSVDVVAPEVSLITESWRFGSNYEYNQEVCAPVGLKNVRFARFPLASVDSKANHEKFSIAWRTQSEFEKQLYSSIDNSASESGLAWGWSYPESSRGKFCRWGLTECGLHLTERTNVRILGFCQRHSVIRIIDSRGAELLHREFDQYFDLCFDADAGAVEIYVSTNSHNSSDDPRPLGFYARQIFLNGSELDLALHPRIRPTNSDPLDIYHKMDQAARSSRGRHSVRLTEIRGPHSPDLEAFLRASITDYDIVVTHNNILRPAVSAISAATASGIPSVLIPHAHLDDDFYHFSDVRQSTLDADLVLAAPKAACKFYEQIGVRKSEYLPAGVDVSQVCSDSDELLFRSVYLRTEPFFLLLGRKAGAKGYAKVIAETEKLARQQCIHLVLIGPDDDGVAVDSPSASYLGYQSRQVVRGAMKSCIGLINMSSSESFGMVLLEAWLAGRPVIANTSCAAFHDLAVHEENALLVSETTLGAAMARLASDSSLCDKLGAAGMATAKQYSWENVCANFVGKCTDLVFEKNTPKFQRALKRRA